MSTFSLRRGAAAALLALALAATGVLAAPSLPRAAADAPDEPDVRGYLTEAFPSLPSDNVFEVTTFERFEYLLNQAGTFAFLVGGPDDARLQAEISHIDTVAKQYGVDKIYLFNPKLDGQYVDVRDYTLRSGEPAAVETQVEALYTRVLTNDLSKDTQTVFNRTDSDPYLYLYDKDHTVDVEGTPTEDRIVSALTARPSAEDLAAEGGVATYRDQIGDVFDAIAVDGQADVTSVSHFTFFTGEYNRRHTTDYPDATRYGGAIFTSETADDFAVYQLSYPELLYLLNEPGDHIILFGGTWCHNTRAVVKAINAAAGANGDPVVYNFDLRIDGTSSNHLHIRDSASALAYLYGDLVSTYLPNITTEYTTNNRITYYPGGDRSLATQSVKRLQVPFLIEYNKDAVKAGQKAPITRGWIHDNGNGTFKEYMTEWWYVNGLRGNSTQGSTGHVNGVAFATEAVTAAQTFFTDFAAEQETTATTTTVASHVADGDTTLTATITANGSTAVGATGSVEFFEVGTPDVSLGTATVNEGVATLTTTFGVGAHSYYAVYSGSDDYRTSSSLTASVTVHSGFAVEALRVGTTVELSATYAVGGAPAEDATGTIEFFEAVAGDDPDESLGEVDVVDGEASLPAISDWVGGTHEYYAVYTPDGSSPYATATSETGSITVPAPVLDVDAALTGTSVTLSAEYGLGGSPATGAAGTVEFFEVKDGPDVSLGEVALSSGAATLPAITDWVATTREFNAVFEPSGGSPYAGATSATESVTVGVPSNAVLTLAPTINGTLKVGKPLTVSLGANYAGAVATKHQWRRDGVAISGATNATYTPTASDRGKKLSVTVTATRSGVAKSATATSPKTAAIGYGEILLSSDFGARLEPSSTGASTVGSKLTAVRPDYATTGLTFSYQWLRDGVAISGAKGSTYTLTTSDLGKQISLKVTASKSGYTSLSLTGLCCALITEGDFDSTGTPKIAGTKKVGSTLSVSGASWSTSSVSARYAWYADGTLIQLSTSKKLLLTWQEKGAVITVKAFGAKNGYADAESALSAATSIVK